MKQSVNKCINLSIEHSTACDSRTHLNYTQRIHRHYIILSVVIKLHQFYGQSQ